MANKTAPDTHFLTFAVEQSAPEQPGPVRLRGMAYSGGLIPQYGWHGDAVIDLASVNLPNQIFALVDHETNKRAGKCSPRLEGNQIIVEGELFDATDAGRGKLRGLLSCPSLNQVQFLAPFLAQFLAQLLTPFLAYPTRISNCLPKAASALAIVSTLLRSSLPPKISFPSR